MKFSEMPYQRPDLDKIRVELEACREGIMNAKTFEEADGFFMRYDKAFRTVQTHMSIAYVRHTIDTADEFYTAEDDFSNEANPQLEEMSQSVMMALMQSPFRKEFSEKYGELLFKNIEIGLKAFSPEIVEDMQEENKLASEYQKLIASAQIEFDGEKRTISQMSPYKTSADDSVREAAWKAEGQWYVDNGDKLDEIYDKLVKCRDRQAKKMGYPDYVTLGYYRMQRNCYDRNDVEKFRKAVVKHIVPLCSQIVKDKADRLEFSYPLTFAENALDFRSGNPKPQVSSDEILAHAKKFYHELSPETAEFIDFMYDNELLDVLSKKGKAAGGYCTEFLDYKAPFIFANFNDTAHDVEVMTHEAGHAFAYYTCRDIVPASSITPTMESAEIHSTSMEFFAWNWVEGFFKQDSDKYRFYHLTSTLLIIPYIVLVDHFQHEMYLHPEYTPAKRHETWAKLMAVYMPWMKLDGSVFYGEGKGWQRQLHIYLYPFYYIDYSFATTIALEFWAKDQKDHKDAWERYMRLVSKGGTQTFTELVETAGLESPFDEQCLIEIADAVKEWISKFDSEKLK